MNKYSKYARNRMSKNLFFYCFIIAIILLLLSATALYGQNDEQRIAPSGKISWDEYGLSFIVPNPMKVIVENDIRVQLRSNDMDIDVNLIDRRQYTDEQIGREVFASASRGGMNMVNASGGELESEGVNGGYIKGVLDDGSDALIIGFVAVNTMYGFIIIIQNAPGAGSKSQSVAESLNLTPPANMIVR